MALAAEQELKHLGESQGMANHDHDLIHELSRRLDSLWRYDQYIANSEEREELRATWLELKSQEEQTVQRLKELVKNEIENHCF